MDVQREIWLLHRRQSHVVSAIVSLAGAAVAGAAGPAWSQADHDYSGPCVDCYSWSGSASVRTGQGIATYRGCGDGEYTLALTCSADSPALTLQGWIPAPNLPDRTVIPATIAVVGRQFHASDPV